MARIKSDAHMYLTETGDAAPAPVNITSVTKATPTVATLAAALPAAAAVGDMVKFTGTGQAALDGKTFRISVIDVTVPAAPKLTLADFDGMTKLTVAVGAVGTVQIFQKAGTLALLEVCMVTITIAGVPPDSIAMDDMCGSTTVLGSPKPPTFSYTGFVDKDLPGFKNLMQASLESPKQLRYMLIDYSAGGGYIFGPVEIGEITITAQTAQGLQFSGSGVFTEMPTYSWAL